MGYFSNGTEGAMFEEAFCVRCVHYDHELGVDKPCPVWMAHLLFAYDECNSNSNAKTILDMLIDDEKVTAPDGHEFTSQRCRMFSEETEEARAERVAAARTAELYAAEVAGLSIAVASAASEGAPNRVELSA